MDGPALLEALRSLPVGAVYALLVGGALIEYLVPPFPGDTVVVVGAALVVAFDWDVAPVFAATTLGSVLGGVIDFEVGRWLIRSGRLDRLGPRRRRAVAHLVGQFERRGAAWIAINRFVPGVRALFFVAAGLAGLRLPAVVAWTAVSAVAWNAVLFGIGALVGGNLERILALVGRYQVVAAVVVSAVIALAVWRAWQGTRDEA